MLSLVKKSMEGVEFSFVHAPEKIVLQKLKKSNSDEEGKEEAEEKFLVGREQGIVDVYLDAKLASSILSRKHAEFTRSMGAFKVAALGLNRTSVNGLVLQQDENHPLKDGDLIAFCVPSSFKGGDTVPHDKQGLVYQFLDPHDASSKKAALEQQDRIRETLEREFQEKLDREKKEILEVTERSMKEEEEKKIKEKTEEFELERKRLEEKAIQLREQNQKLEKENSSVLDGLRGDLECTICYGFMVQPYGFSCSHKFCKKCILDLIKSHELKKPNSLFECPTCRVAVTSVNADSLMASLVAKLMEKEEALDSETFKEWKAREQACSAMPPGAPKLPVPQLLTTPSTPAMPLPTQGHRILAPPVFSPPSRTVLPSILPVPSASTVALQELLGVPLTLIAPTPHPPAPNPFLRATPPHSSTKLTTSATPEILGPPPVREHVGASHHPIVHSVSTESPRKKPKKDMAKKGGKKDPHPAPIRPLLNSGEIIEID